MFDTAGTRPPHSHEKRFNGVTTKAEVERAARIPAAAAPAEPLRGVRRAMADRMTKAHAEVPRATVTDEADVEAWGRKRLGYASCDSRNRGWVPSDSRH